MSDIPLDQTQFLTEVSVPETQETLANPSENEQPKKKFPLPILIGSAAIVLLLLIVAIFLTRRTPSTLKSTPTPIPTARPVENAGIKQDIEPYLERIQGLNPEENDHPFPPVDFTVRLQQQKQ